MLLTVTCVICASRMFELEEYTKFVYLDADMLVVGV
jgi:alpha-N-acetylglucosamine transferase